MRRCSASPRSVSWSRACATKCPTPWRRSTRCCRSCNRSAASPPRPSRKASPPSARTSRACWPSRSGSATSPASAAPGPVAMDAAVEEAISLLRHSSYGAGLRVEYRGAPGAAVLARPGSLQQVLFNILLNAAQAMQGAGLIEAQARIVDAKTLVLYLRDCGPGIPLENLQRVFEPFFTTTQAGEGTGLGLAISYAIVHELGGAIRAYNHPQGGACFELLLPLCEGA